MRKLMTRYEVKLWLRLRELRQQGFRFRRQAPIEGFIADFACHASKLIIEADGSQHGFETHAVHDAVRDRALEALGYLTLRFSNGEIWDNIEGVVEQIFLTGKARLP